MSLQALKKWLRYSGNRVSISSTSTWVHTWKNSTRVIPIINQRFPHLPGKSYRFALNAFPIAAVVIYLCLFVFSQPSLPIGDGLMHALEIREIAETGELPKHFTYMAVDVAPEGVVYRGIDYPLTFYLTGSFVWLLGGLTGLYMWQAMTGILTVLFVYLIFRRIHPVIAGLVASATLLIPLERFAMINAIEPLLLSIMLGSIYFYGRFLESPMKEEWKFALLTGIFLGFAICLKQQGYILAASIGLHGLGTYCFAKFRGQANQFRNLVLILIATLGIAAIPSIDLASRNGSLLGVDRSFWGLENVLPMLRPNMPVDREASAFIHSIISYGVEYESFWQVLHEFIAYPITYRHTLPTMLLADITWVPIATTILVAGLIYSVVKRWNFGIFLFVVFGMEVFVAKQFNDILINYHQLGISIVFILLIIGAIAVYHWLSFAKLKYILPLGMALIVAFVMIGANSWIEVVHARTWGSPGSRLNEIVIQDYQEMGEFVRDSVPPDSLGLGYELPFSYFGRRVLISPTWWGGADLGKVWHLKDDGEVLAILSRYNIEYLYIDRRQSQWKGAGDWIPESGLLEIIDQSNSFQQIYRTKRHILVLYKVLYPDENENAP